MEYKKVKLIIFDVGGVVYDRTNIGPAIARDFNISYRKFLEYANISGIQGLQKGFISEEKFITVFAYLLHRKIPTNLWTVYFHPQPMMKTLQMIENLKTRFRVVAGTNTIQPHYNVHSQRGDYLVFPKVYASHEIHYSKPDREFYEFILQAEGFTPEETVFIDDAHKNVEGAKHLGIHSILFTDELNLAEALQPLLSFNTISENRKE